MEILELRSTKKQNKVNHYKGSIVDLNWEKKAAIYLKID